MKNRGSFSWLAWSIFWLGVAGVHVLLAVRSSRAEVACFPAEQDILSTIRNIEVIRIESERQTELLKELRAASRKK